MSVIRVRFSQSRFTGSEATGFVLVNLELVGGRSANAFDVTVTPSEQSSVSAEGNIVCIIVCWLKSVWLTGGVDFNTATLTATFGSGVTMSNVSVPVFSDDIVERTEQFDLMLTVPPSLAPAIRAGGRNSALGVIMDSTSKYSIRYYTVIMLILKLIRMYRIIPRA